MRSGVIVLGVAFALFAIGPEAVKAHPVIVQDGASDLGPNEELPLDIREVVQRHGAYSGSHQLSFKVRMEDPFGNSQLHMVEDEYYAVSIHLDIDRDDKFDRVLIVNTEVDNGEHTPYAEMTSDVRGRWAAGGRSTGYAKISRPSTDSLKVQFPERLVRRKGVDRFRFALRAVSSPEPGIVVFDYAPHSETVRGHSS